MSENQDGNSVMDRTIDWGAEIADIAGAYSARETRQSWLARAARKSTTSYWHIKALFYGELKDPKYSVAHRILSAADRARIEGARRDAAKLENICHGMAAALERTDPDFHSQDIDALRRTARMVGDLDSAGTKGNVT